MKDDPMEEAVAAGVPPALLAWRESDWPQPRPLARFDAFMDARRDFEERTGVELPEARDIPHSLPFNPELDGI